MKKILLTLLFAPIFALATFAQTSTDLVITEIFYNMPGPGIDSLEFIEIHNPSTAAVNLKNYTFRTAVTDTFPDVSLAAGGYYTVAFNSKYFKKIFGTDPGHQWKTIVGGNNALNNTGERIDLHNAAGALLDSVRYVADVPWPSLANGGGPSLVFCDLTKDNGNGANWLVSSNLNTAKINGTSIYASPGKADCKGTPPGGAVTAQNLAVNTNKATPINVNLGTLITPNTATVTISQQPKGGSFTKVNGNNYIYLPNATFCGTDTVKYKAVVGTEMATGVVTIKVNCPPSTYPKYTIGKVTLDANADFIPDSTGIYCDIEGVIHSPNYATPTGPLPAIQFCIIDANNKEDGIIVNRTGKIFAYGTPKEGDKVRVWGRIGQLSGATIITPDSIFTSGTAPVFAPTVVTKLDESTESMLVEIKGLTLSNQTQWGAGGANATGYTLTTSDGTNTYTVRVDKDITDLFISGGPKTKKFDIIGIGFQFAQGGGGGGGGGGTLNTGYQIMPRRLSDMKWQVATNDVALGQNVSVFPNPFNTEITVKLAENVERINVHNTIGQLMFTIEQPSENQVINTTTWSEGMYFISVEKDGRHFTTKIVK
jgi:hypothetical protein